MTHIDDQIAYAIATKGTTRRLLTAAIVEHGFAPDDNNVRTAVKRIQSLRAERDARRQVNDSLVVAATIRPFKLMRLKADNKRRADIATILAAPIAAHWRSDRRAKVVAAPDREDAMALAAAATLEAITRIATTKWGFTRRHTSRSSGKADSRYLYMPKVGEVRISDHTIPVYGEREARYEQNGGPSWGEIIVSPATLNWSLTRWRRELILRAAGRR